MDKVAKDVELLESWKQAVCEELEAREALVAAEAKRDELAAQMVAEIAAYKKGDRVWVQRHGQEPEVFEVTAVYLQGATLNATADEVTVGYWGRRVKRNGELDKRESRTLPLWHIIRKAILTGGKQ